ncbi:hypothetical protein GCT13_05020 [Paraburkholderia sp. CNPSo 3157]|uniref:Uncharacterized protein n=1 Tax=Paraburkholderia franconis TaxID=2654983 RepID=A0A7X1N6J8_9BURK|nr:hypothetical protein [Paraburkholderia franconis]MPW16308.1 hypothetical protein [Paraburkholderia franconis]
MAATHPMLNAAVPHAKRYAMHIERQRMTPCYEAIAGNSIASIEVNDRIQFQDVRCVSSE